MKSYRLVLVFCVFGVSLLACAWVLGFINEVQMFDMSGRVLGLVAILGLCGGVVYALMRGPSESQNETRPTEPGPKF